MHYQKCDIFFDDLKETRFIWHPELDFRGAHGDSSCDCPRKNRDEWDPCARSYTVQLVTR